MTDDTEAGAEQIRQEIARTRADLAQTVDALQDKLDVKTRAEAKAHEVAASLAATASRLKEQAPPQVQDALDRGAAGIGPAAAKAEPYRSKIALGAGVLFVLLLMKRRRRSR